MKSKFISFAVASFVFAILALAPSAILAQEGELQVVDEVIAQINDDVDHALVAEARNQRAR